MKNFMDKNFLLQPKRLRNYIIIMRLRCQLLIIIVI